MVELKMGGPFKGRDLTGLRFGKWAVLGFAGRDCRSMPWWNCQCDCGKEQAVPGANLTHQLSTQCNGCNVRINTIPAGRAALKSINAVKQATAETEFENALVTLGKTDAERADIAARVGEGGRRYYKAKAAGICPVSTCSRPWIGKGICPDCQAAVNEWKKLYYQRRKEAGICQACGNQHESGRVLCDSCNQRARSRYTPTGKPRGRPPKQKQLVYDRPRNRRGRPRKAVPHGSH